MGSKLCAKKLRELCALCERKNSPACFKNVLSLTELTDLIELFGAQFRAHRRPPAYRVHRSLLLKRGVG